MKRTTGASLARRTATPRWPLRVSLASAVSQRTVSGCDPLWRTSGATSGVASAGDASPGGSRGVAGVALDSTRAHNCVRHVRVRP